MPRRQFRLAATDASALRAELNDIRRELKVPGEFSAAAQADAERAAASSRPPDLDLTDIPFVTIDPPSSMDLDQALHLSRDGAGLLVRYVIADVASFVEPGSALDAEVHERGVTYYGPDSRAPLHPVELSEDAASLLPGEDRPALVWEIRLDSSGERRGDAVVRRALVRSRAKLDYAGVHSPRPDTTGGIDEYARMMNEAGMRPADVVFYDVTPLVPPLDRIVRRWARRWREHPERTVSRGLGRWMGTAYLMVARRAGGTDGRTS